MFRPLLLISFCSGRNGQNILYRHENRYHNTPHSTSDQISAYFGVFQPFLPISAEIHISTGTRFWLKKKKKKILTSFFFWVSDPSSSCFLFLLLLLLVFFFFFWWVSNPSSSFFSSSGFWSCQSPFLFLFVCCTSKW